jgi:hypothetical protein
MTVQRSTEEALNKTTTKMAAADVECSVASAIETVINEQEVSFSL